MVKTFDCVQMKHSAGKKISKKLSRMTTVQQLSYWQDRHVKLVELQEKLRKQKSVLVKSKKR